VTNAHSTLRRLVAALLITALATICTPIGVAHADAQPPLPGYGCDAPLPDGGTPLAFPFASANGLLSMAEPTDKDLRLVSAKGKYNAGSKDHITARWKKYNDEINSGSRTVDSPLTWPEYRRKYVQMFNNRVIGSEFEHAVGKELGLTGDGWRHNVKVPAKYWPAGTTPVNRRVDFFNLEAGVKMLYELKSGADIDKAQLIDLVKAAQATGSRLIYVFGKPPSKTALGALRQVAQEAGNGAVVETRCFKSIPQAIPADPNAPLSTDGMNPADGPLGETIDNSPDSPEKAAEEDRVGRDLGAEFDLAEEAKAEADERAGQGAPAPAPAQVKPTPAQPTPRPQPRPQAPADPAPAPESAPQPQSAPEPESAPEPQQAPMPAPGPGAGSVPAPVGSAPIVVGSTVPIEVVPPVAEIPQEAPVELPAEPPVYLPQTPASVPEAPSANQIPEAPSAPEAPVSAPPLGAPTPTPATAPGSTAPGGIDFTSLQLRYVADTNDAGPGIRYAFAANGSPGGAASYGGRRAAQMASDAFLVWMALDPNLFWVNLRPDEPNRIIDGTFGRTQAGQVLLEADLAMKNESATLQKQDTDLGRKFVDALQGRKCYLGRRLWIEPLPATVHEDGGQLYIVDTPLTVKIGHDNGYDITPGTDPCTDQDPAVTQSNGKLFEDMIMPTLIDHVNHAPEFADLRRVYASRVAAEWFRKRNAAKPTVYANVVGSGNIDKWTTPWDPHEVFDRYLQSLHDGVASFSWTEQRGATTYTYTNRWGGVDFSKVDLKEMGDAEFNKQQPGTAAAASRSLFTAQVLPQAGPGGNQIWLGGLSSQRPMSEVWKGDPALFVQPPQAIELLAAATSNPVFYVAIALPVLGWLAVVAVMWRRRQQATRQWR
jgi:hypothetical protein